MSNTNGSSYCEGCRTYNKKHGTCQSVDVTLFGRCPCSTCLIKAMCEVSCRDYHNFKGLEYHDHKSTVKQ